MKSFPPPLSPDEEEYYLQKYLEGDLEAKHILIERNLRLVAHIIKKYQKILKGEYKNNQKGAKHYCFTRFTNHIPIHTRASAMISSMPKEEVSPKNAKERSTLKIGLVNE